jgi:hypothetical protein
VCHTIWVDLGSSRAACSPRGLPNMSGDAPWSVPWCFCPEIGGHCSHLVRIICADSWLGTDLHVDDVRGAFPTRNKSEKERL